MLTTPSETLTCIPQQAPFVAVHSIVRVSDEEAHTRFEILSDSIFVTNGKINEAGLIENMAQTAAAQMGYRCKEKNLPVPLGYLASVRDLTIDFFPPVGAVLDTMITITNKVMDVVLLDAHILYENRPVCRCEMRVFMKSSS